MVGIFFDIQQPYYEPIADYMVKFQQGVSIRSTSTLLKCYEIEFYTVAWKFIKHNFMTCVNAAKIEHKQ